MTHAPLCACNRLSSAARVVHRLNVLVGSVTPSLLSRHGGMKKPIVTLLAAILATSVAAARPSFDRKAWREDYSTLKHELEQSYSHLAWAASPASGVDLPSLDHRTRVALDAARSDADASAALVSFIAGFHDGHLAIVVTSEQAGAIAEPPPRAPDTDAQAACA